MNQHHLLPSRELAQLLRVRARGLLVKAELPDTTEAEADALVDAAMVDHAAADRIEQLHGSLGQSETEARGYYTTLREVERQLEALKKPTA